MMQVVELKVLENYCIWIKFNDGSSKTINIKPFLGKGFTEELLVQENFRKVFIETGGGIAWENGYDFCPNFLYQL